MLISKRLTVGLIGLGGLALLSSSAIAQDTRIGVTAAVNPEVAGTPPSQARRILAVGANVFSQERVVTGARGQTQMLFLDESALTIGPNSDMVLDEFIYDPETETGSLVMNATKGVFRLVGGKISKKNAVLLKTPTATIGIRGGIALTNIADGGATSATFLFGDRMSVTSEGVTKVATRPGYQITVDLGGVPSDPAPVDPAQLEASLDTLESGEDQSGGSDDAPDDSDVAASGVGAAGSANDPSAIAPDGLTLGELLGVGDSSEGTRKTLRNSQQDTATEGTAGGLNIAGLSGRYRHDGTFGTSDGSLSLDIPFDDGSVVGGRFNVQLASFLTIPGVEAGTFSFGPDGTDSPFGPIFGTGFLNAAEDFGFVEFEESNFPGDTLVAWAGIPTQLSAFPSTRQITFFDLQDDFVLESNLPFIRTGGGIGDDSPTEGAILWEGSTGDNFGAARIFIEGSGSSQKSAASVIGGRLFDDDNIQTASISGFARGSSMTASNAGAIGSVFFNSEVQTIRDGLGASGAAFYGVSAPNAFVLGSLQPTAGQGAEERDANFGSAPVNFRPNVVAISEDGPGALPSSRTARTLNGQTGGFIQEINSLGGVNTTVPFSVTLSRPQDVAIVTDPNTDSLTVAIDVDSTNAQILTNQGGTGFGHSLFVDDDTFGTIENDSSEVSASPASSFDYLTTADRLDSSGFLPAGVTLCECQFLAWGFWGIDIDDGGTISQRVHLAQWVAGEVASQVQINFLTGTATYDGHAIASVLNGSDLYTAVGGLDMVMDFGTPANSTLSITDFDGGSFVLSGGLAFSGNGGLLNDFVNAAGNGLQGQGVHAGVNGFIEGSFMQGGGSPAAEVGAHWRVTNGSTYTASGIFAGAAAVAP